MAGVKVTGVRQTLRALKAVAPDLEKEVRKSINESVRDVVVTARGFIPDQPMTGWTAESWGHRGWDKRTAQMGIRRMNPSRRGKNGGYFYSIDVANLSAPGMIYELAGSKSNGNSPQGRQFISNIERSGLHRPLRRVVVRAGIEKGEKAKESILAALDNAQKITQARLDAIRG